jgi:hypothetical protein
MRSIGVHRTTHTTLASDTAAQNQDVATQREMARQKVRHNMVKKTGNLDSSQRTAIISSDLKSLARTDFSNPNQNTVKSALSRVRNSGCIPPKKKGFVKT